MVKLHLFLYSPLIRAVVGRSTTVTVHSSVDRSVYQSIGIDLTVCLERDGCERSLGFCFWVQAEG